MKKLLILTFALTILLVSCNDDDDEGPGTDELTLNITGLEDLGSGFAYEGWIIVDGNPVSTGIFTVDGSGNLSETTFDVDADDLESATMFVLSIEPSPDPDPSPALTKLLAGPFNGTTANLSTSTVGSDFGTATGEYIIAAPTGTGAMNETKSGIWFLDNSSGSPMAGLDLPALEPGWKYEGWAVISGMPVTTGTFTSVSMADADAPFSGTNPGPPFPGEDFLMNAPSGLTFPTDLSGGMAVISIEPDPDNSPAPFTLKPLAGMIPSNLTGGPYEMDNNANASFPAGSVSR